MGLELEKNKIYIACIVGYSGSGKDTTIQKLAERKPDLYRIVPTMTTRKPRTEDEPGIITLTEEEFEQEYTDNQIMAYMHNKKYKYMTVQDSFKPGVVNLYTVNYEAMQQLRTKKEKMGLDNVEIIEVHLDCIDQVRYARLRKRYMESEELQKQFKTSEEYITARKEFDETYEMVIRSPLQIKIHGTYDTPEQVAETTHDNLRRHINYRI